MILIPEIETVVILTPKCATKSLAEAIRAQYRQSIFLYRHMEADGVPAGYDTWEKVGVVRHPTERLWSLYKFLKTFEGSSMIRSNDQAYIDAMRESVRGMDFNEWILVNERVFTSPYNHQTGRLSTPFFTVRHAMPDTKKSQYIYLRPDLGTKIFTFEDLALCTEYLGVELGEPRHVTEPLPRPELTAEAEEHMHRYFSWEFTEFY